MQLYIMRHGEAQQQAMSDSQRELTAHGRSEVLDIAKLLTNESFDLILVSPFIRTQQTADTLISVLNTQAKIEQCSLITPSGSATDVHNYLDGLIAEEQYQKILLVSHMPLISYLLSELTTGSHMPIFQTAALAKIDYNVEQMAGDFVEMLCPFNICDI